MFLFVRADSCFREPPYLFMTLAGSSTRGLQWNSSNLAEDNNGVVGWAAFSQLFDPTINQVFQNYARAGQKKDISKGSRL